MAAPWTADVSNQSYLKVKQVEGDRSIMTYWALNNCNFGQSRIYMPQTALFKSDELWIGGDDDLSAFCEYVNALLQLYPKRYLNSGVVMTTRFIWTLESSL